MTMAGRVLMVVADRTLAVPGEPAASEAPSASVVVTARLVAHGLGRRAGSPGCRPGRMAAMRSSMVPDGGGP